MLAAFVPWLGVMLQQWANWPATSQPFTLPELAGKTLTAFTAGLAVPPGQATVAAFVLGTAALLGCLPRRSPAPPAVIPGAGSRLPGLALVILCALTPVAVMYLLSLRRPLYNPKFLLVAVPAFYLLCAVGIARAAGWLARSSAGRESGRQPRPWRACRHWRLRRFCRR